jgi:hypothetical protein
MKPLDVDGHFWLAARPEEQIAGRLTFDVSNGAELNLIGSFDEPDRTFGKRLPPRRILGVAGKQLLTLDECTDFGSSIEIPGTYRQRYRPETIFAGAHFSDDEPLEFSAITVSVRHLEHWIGRSAVRSEITKADASGEISEMRLMLTPIEPSTVSTSQGELELGFRWGLRGDHFVESTVTQACYLRLHTQAPTSFRQLVKACMALQHVVTLGVDVTAPITALRVWHPQRSRTHPSGEILHEPIDVYTRLHGGDAPEAERARMPHEMLFTFDDLGGLPAVTRWLDVSVRLEPVVGALLSHRYVPQLYAENRLQNAVFAAETFDRLRFPNEALPVAEAQARVDEILAAAPSAHREWLRGQLEYSNEPRFRRRLLRLAEHAGEAFRTLVHDVKAWAAAVTNTRNRAVVHRNTAHEPEGLPWSLYLLSESTYFLVVLCLLRECVAPEATLLKVQEHRRFRWLAEQLEAEASRRRGGSHSTAASTDRKA